MPIYVAMLRGINVGGNKRVKMDKLRSALEALGLEQVKTYIQSGNVVFKSPRMSPLALSRKLEERILKDFGFSVSVISRTADEIENIIANNPLLKQSGIDSEKLHVVFLSDTPAAAALKKLAELTLSPDQSRCHGKEVYLYFPNGVSGSSLWKHPLDRVLSVEATMRNWKTVNTLHQMCMDCH
ncbi:MAG: DUF1697 domain-containing protein [Candidatus Sulfotelmatobacter sp.]